MLSGPGGAGSEALLEQELGWELCTGIASCQIRVLEGRAVSSLQERLPGCEMTSEDRTVYSLHILYIQPLSDV